MSLRTVVRILARGLGIAGPLAALATVLGSFSSWSWLTELASHFRVQYLAVLVVAAVAALAARRWGRALVLAAFAAANAAVIYPLYVAQPTEVATPAKPLRVMLSNVFAPNERFDLVLAAVEHYDPDVLVVEEVDATWLNHLDTLRDVYPYKVSDIRDYYFGIALYSKYRLEQTQVMYLGAVPSIAAEVQAPAPLYVLATHAMPPLAGLYARMRNSQLEEIGRFLQTAPHPLILLGDLNVTPWSAYFQRLLGEAHLGNSMNGYGLQYTWPAQVWPVGVPIDHCLYSAGVRVTNRQIGPFVGSDHYPLIVDLEVGASTLQTASK